MEMAEKEEVKVQHNSPRTYEDNDLKPEMTSEHAHSPKSILPDDGRVHDGNLHCAECGVDFESVQSLEVHRHYHQGNLLSRWALEHGPSYQNGPEEPRHNGFDNRLHSYQHHQGFQTHQTNALLSNGVSHPCDRCGAVLPSHYALIDHINMVHRDLSDGYMHPPTREAPDSSSEILDLDSQRVHVYQPGQGPPPLVSMGGSYQAAVTSSGGTYGSTNWMAAQFGVSSVQSPTSFSSAVGYPTNQPGVILHPPMQHPGQPPTRWMTPSQGHRGFPSAIMMQSQLPSSTSGRDVRPKAFYCAACNKGFTSSGHLKRHYSTNIHQNAVKASGLPDPALQYPTRKKSKLKTADSAPSTQALSVSPGPSSPGNDSSDSSGDVSQQFYDDSQSTPPTPTASQGIMSPGHYRQDFQSVTQSSQFLQSSNGNQQNGNPATTSASQTVPAPNPSPAQTTNGPPPYSELPQYQSHMQASHFSVGMNGSSSTPLRSLASFAAGPLYPPYTSTYNQEVPSFSPYSALPPNFQAPLSNGTSVRGVGPYEETRLPVGFNNNNTVDLDDKNALYNRASVHSDGESSNSVLSTHSEPVSPERSNANIILSNLTEADVSALTGEGSGKYRCSYCEKTFNRTCYLTQHCNSYHVGERPFKCVICGKRFSDEKNYVHHQGKHKGEKPYKCNECPKQFNHKTDLNRHMCIHTGHKPYICRVCQKGFIRKDHMHKHVATHIMQRRRLQSA